MLGRTRGQTRAALVSQDDLVDGHGPRSSLVDGPSLKRDATHRMTTSGGSVDRRTKRQRLEENSSTDPETSRGPSSSSSSPGIESKTPFLTETIRTVASDATLNQGSSDDDSELSSLYSDDERLPQHPMTEAPEESSLSSRLGRDHDQQAAQLPAFDELKGVAVAADVAGHDESRGHATSIDNMESDRFLHSREDTQLSCTTAQSSCKRWTAEEVERLRKLRADGKSCTPITKHMTGRSECSVASRMQHLKFGTSTSPFWTAEEDEKLRKLLGEGKSYAFIVDHFPGRSLKTTQGRATRLGLTSSRLPWTDEEDGKLRKLRDEGASLEKIVKLMGRSRLSVGARVHQLSLSRNNSHAWSKSEEENLTRITDEGKSESEISKAGLLPGRSIGSLYSKLSDLREPHATRSSITHGHGESRIATDFSCSSHLKRHGVTNSLWPPLHIEQDRPSTQKETAEVVDDQYALLHGYYTQGLATTENPESSWRSTSHDGCVTREQDALEKLYQDGIRLTESSKNPQWQPQAMPWNVTNSVAVSQSGKAWTSRDLELLDRLRLARNNDEEVRAYFPGVSGEKIRQEMLQLSKPWTKDELERIDYFVKQNAAPTLAQALCPGRTLTSVEHQMKVASDAASLFVDPTLVSADYSTATFTDSGFGLSANGGGYDAAFEDDFELLKDFTDSDGYHGASRHNDVGFDADEDYLMTGDMRRLDREYDFD